MVRPFADLTTRQLPDQNRSLQHLFVREVSPERHRIPFSCQIGWRTTGYTVSIITYRRVHHPARAWCYVKGGDLYVIIVNARPSPAHYCLYATANLCHRKELRKCLVARTWSPGAIFCASPHLHQVLVCWPRVPPPPPRPPHRLKPVQRQPLPLPNPHSFSQVGTRLNGTTLSSKSL